MVNRIVILQNLSNQYLSTILQTIIVAELQA